MVLTRAYLESYQKSMMTFIPENVIQELLDQLGHYPMSDGGYYHDYTEQDICEQIRNKLQKHNIW